MGWRLLACSRPSVKWPDHPIHVRLSGAICRPGGITSGLHVNRQSDHVRVDSYVPNLLKCGYRVACAVCSK